MKIKFKNILLVSTILTAATPLSISCSSQQNDKKVDKTNASETNIEKTNETNASEKNIEKTNETNASETNSEKTNETNNSSNGVTNEESMITEFLSLKDETKFREMVVNYYKEKKPKNVEETGILIQGYNLHKDENKNNGAPFYGLKGMSDSENNIIFVIKDGLNVNDFELIKKDPESVIKKDDQNKKWLINIKLKYKNVDKIQTFEIPFGNEIEETKNINSNEANEGSSNESAGTGNSSSETTTTEPNEGSANESAGTESTPATTTTETGDGSVSNESAGTESSPETTTTKPNEGSANESAGTESTPATTTTETGDGSVSNESAGTESSSETTTTEISKDSKEESTIIEGTEEERTKYFELDKEKFYLKYKEKSSDKKSVNKMQLYKVGSNSFYGVKGGGNGKDNRILLLKSDTDSSVTFKSNKKIDLSKEGNKFIFTVILLVNNEQKSFKFEIEEKTDN
ncbi:hypothetical protein KQ876_00540 [Mycoplasma sp. CSL7491-lung]|uniref:hypothetical protein n=1 Tax=Mycoplasma sp. CSL7491-lung TaxID=549718 RepID=UPI001C0F80A2|nr:hypothetical protein [Mycoplasma sp. CSL7491-lung]MBU4692695.1 hypothetical protein [Mycoplasma sp. CSL7491-lung]